MQFMLKNCLNNKLSSFEDLTSHKIEIIVANGVTFVRTSHGHMTSTLASQRKRRSSKIPRWCGSKHNSIK
jgi:accessory colonization factor AcfC